MYREISNIQIFYQKLYTKDDTVWFYLLNTLGIHITPEEFDQCKEDINKKELFDANDDLEKQNMPRRRWAVD